MTNWSEHTEFQNALSEHLLNSELSLPDDVIFESGIDCVFVMVSGKPVFIVGLPPVSNYPVRETEFTNNYLRRRRAVAV